MNHAVRRFIFLFLLLIWTLFLDYLMSETMLPFIYPAAQVFLICLLLVIIPSIFLGWYIKR
jgi:hypothetical protein